MAIVALVFVSIVSGVSSSPVAADTIPIDGSPETVSSDALPTVQIDGVVWSQIVVGSTVYAGGNFTTARPAGAAPGVSTSPRSNLLAYNIQTGELINDFAPAFNGQVLGLAASPDGSRVYAVGEFTKVNGINRYRAVALNPSNGAVVTSFTPGFNARARAIVATNDAVYIGGSFTDVSGVTRARLAAIRPSNGAVLDWSPSVSGGGNQVLAMALTPDRSKLIVGGNYTTLNGNQAFGLGAVDPANGETRTWNAANSIKNSGYASAITSLVAANDSIYGTGYVAGTDAGLPKGNLEGSFAADANSGDIRWVNSCHGDSYSVFPQAGVAYSAGHAHDCRDIRGFPQTNPWTYKRGFAVTDNATQASRRNFVPGYFNWEGTPAPRNLTWFPELEAGSFTGQNQAAWSTSGNADYVVFGGEFQRVNGVRQQGLVRFATKSLAPNKSAPALSGTDFQPALSSPASGLVRGSIPANYDSDNEQLSYRVFRQGNPEPIYSTALQSTFYHRPMITFADSEVTPGQVYRYRVDATDQFGNNRTGDWTDVVVASEGTLGAYAKAVMDSGPSFYWRLGETNGTTINDAVGRMNGARAGTIAQNTAGAIKGDPSTAYTFAGGNSGSRASTDTQVPDQQEFAAEVWIKTATTAGGRIIGFSNGTTGPSGKLDRHVYMRNDGKLTFGAKAADVMQTITSVNSYNDNKYHHVVAQMGAGGMELFVDGQRVASNPTAYGSTEYNAYWRLGGDSLAGWPGRPTSDYFAGTLDEVALYPTVLTSAQVSQHWSLSGWGVQLPNQSPTAAFVSTPNRLAVAFDGTSSSDPDGAIVDYQWDFGDGTTGSGASTSHTYAAEGTYLVKLTVKDDRDGVAVTETGVSVTNPNTLPVAAFSATTSDLTAILDASSAQDADGLLVGYHWDFGDGDEGVGKTTNHTYGTPGTYDVTVTVVDDRGGSASLTKPVNVAAPIPALARDTFDRTISNGWGSADKGGPWALTGLPGNFSVSAGNATMVTPVGNTRAAVIGNLGSTSTDLTLNVATNLPATNTYVSVAGRDITSTNSYRTKLRFFANGDVNATIVRVVNGVETTIAGGRLAGLSYSTNQQLRVRFQVVGSGTASLKLKVWRASDPEPGSWSYQASDSTAALQTSGGIGFFTYVSGASGGTPATTRFSDVAVVSAAG